MEIITKEDVAKAWKHAADLYDRFSTRQGDDEGLSEAIIDAIGEAPRYVPENLWRILARDYELRYGKYRETDGGRDKPPAA